MCIRVYEQGREDNIHTNAVGVKQHTVSTTAVIGCIPWPCVCAQVKARHGDLVRMNVSSSDALQHEWAAMRSTCAVIGLTLVLDTVPSVPAHVGVPVPVPPLPPAGQDTASEPSSMPEPPVASTPIPTSNAMFTPIAQATATSSKAATETQTGEATADDASTQLQPPTSGTGRDADGTSLLELTGEGADGEGGGLAVAMASSEHTPGMVADNIGVAIVPMTGANTAATDNTATANTIGTVATSTSNGNSNSNIAAANTDTNTTANASTSTSTSTNAGASTAAHTAGDATNAMAATPQPAHAAPLTAGIDMIMAAEQNTATAETKPDDGTGDDSGTGTAGMVHTADLPSLSFR